MDEPRGAPWSSASGATRGLTSPIQHHRFLALYTPLGEDVLLLTGVDGRERLSGLSSFQLEMRSLDHNIHPHQLVGKKVTFRIGALTDRPRYFNGYVSEFFASGEDHEYRCYRAVVVPWLWFLTQTSDCRIFQEKTALEIVTEVFGDPEIVRLAEFQLNGPRPGEGVQREYCVQYRETDFNFVSRLLEEEGIFYYFTHQVNEGVGSHTLVLANERQGPVFCDERYVELRDASGHPALPDGIFEWQRRCRFVPGRFSHSDYDYHDPYTDLTAEENSIHELPARNGAPRAPSGDGRFELYDYPGRYQELDEGRRLARVRMQEEESRHDVIRAAGSCRSFTAGGRFVVTNLEQLLDRAGIARLTEEERTFLITSVRHQATEPAPYRSNRDQPTIKHEYRNRFECIPASVPFRPVRATRKPTIQGTQTAMVVGPENSEIHTDGCGRVKVQFHWDRRGTSDEDSSCWIRVAQIWAGKRWGAHFWPRIGQEVVVSYLEGDPDRPLIVGSVYNDDHTPPYELPEHQTLSGIKTNTTPDGGGFNELRFEDRKGREQVFIHAQRRMDQRVRGSLYETNGGNREIRVGSERGGELNTFVHHDVNDHFQGEEFTLVEGDVHSLVEGEVLEKFDRNQKTRVGQTFMLTAQDIVTETSGSTSHKSGQVLLEGTREVSIKGGCLKLEALQGLSLKVGCSFINITPCGVEIVGPMVRINSGGCAPAASSADAAESFDLLKPIDAAAATTAVPGERGRGGGGRSRSHEPVTAEPHVAPPYPPPSDICGDCPPLPPPDAECTLVSALSRCEHGRMAEEGQTLQVVPSRSKDHDLIELAAVVQNNCGEHAEWTISGSDESPQQGNIATFKAYPSAFSHWWTPTEEGRSYGATATACNGPSRHLTIEAFRPEQLNTSFLEYVNGGHRLADFMQSFHVDDLLDALLDEFTIAAAPGSATIDCGWREYHDHRAYFGYDIAMHFDPMIEGSGRVRFDWAKGKRIIEKIVDKLDRLPRSVKRIIETVLGEADDESLNLWVEAAIVGAPRLNMEWHRHAPAPEQPVFVEASGPGLSGPLEIDLNLGFRFGKGTKIALDLGGTLRFLYHGDPMIDAQGIGLRNQTVRFGGLTGSISVDLDGPFAGDDDVDPDWSHQGTLIGASDEPMPSSNGPHYFLSLGDELDGRPF